jgi:hypothetical protein
MRFHWLIGAAALVLLMQISPSARATLMGATVQSASYLNVSSPPPPASPTECTIIDCMILDYEGPSGPTNSPLPTVPVTYLEDSLTETTVSVGDTQITITNNLAGFFLSRGGGDGVHAGGFQRLCFHVHGRAQHHGRGGGQRHFLGLSTRQPYVDHGFDNRGRGR